MMCLDVGFQNKICDLLGGVLDYMAHPIISQACVLRINRARVQHYPGTRPVALVNVR